MGSFLTLLCAGAYCLVAAVFVGNCFNERRAKEAHWDGYRVAGIVLCMFWPLLLVAVAFTVRGERARRHPVRWASR